MALGTVRPGTDIILGANKEYSSSYAPLKLLCITAVPCACLFKLYWDVARNLLHKGCTVKFT